ncbi:NAD(P)H-dependent oxidoreductase [Gluconobacter cerinus]|uniref:NAD(P)H dehydrogenase n=1 Tax=Gluconobacter cerinus TaxID=38307 RepID=A0AAV5NJ89_9PROT|nr:NAD(P)H-dependent oxidoreductase [Gluconobacter cerinus]GBQ96136.1 NADH/NADPH quinone oxidoreductase [Gluconobacter cerinus NRIC 0229]GLQ63917.1 NAD(P)H dehydrogenase [Gluconobacter cerinus]
MNVLIVYAHPEPASFNGALLRTSIETLEQNGHTVAVSDLYANDFEPRITRADFQGKAVNLDVLNIPQEQNNAFETNTLSFDIQREQERLATADLVIFQFPLWWFSMPAILKGWIDRVFSRGFAYAAGRKYDTGLFHGKLAMICTTTGTSADTYAPDGIDGDILTVLWPIHNGIFRYTGFDVLPPFVAYMPGRLDFQERTYLLEKYKEKLLEIDSTPHLFFHPKNDYGPNERLKPGVLARSGVQRNT